MKISAHEKTVFVYDGGARLVAEYTAWTAPDPAPSAQVSYLTQDHLGSTRVITNNLGQVIKRSDYMAYGDEVITANRSSANGYEQPSETRKGYTGYERDIESGLDFAQARYYNPNHGRFTSVDPLTASANVKDPQTFNRYTYALNSPYKFTDPLGLVSQSTGANGGWLNSGGFQGGCWAQSSSCDFEDNDGGAPLPEIPVSEGHTNEAAEPSGGSTESSSQQQVEPPAAPPEASADQNDSSFGQPLISVTEVALVTQGAKRTPGGTVILDDKKQPIIEDTVVATGNQSRTQEEFELDIKNGAASLRINEAIYVRMRITVRDDKDRAALTEARVLERMSDSIMEATKEDIKMITDSGGITVYVRLRLSSEGALRSGPVGFFTVRAFASYIDEYDSTTNQIAVNKTVFKDTRISLVNSTPKPTTKPFRSPKTPF